jgi:hypothetical protein
MSFDLTQVHRLKAAGDPMWSEYCRLVAECDASAYDSPAHRALGEFQQAWEQDPNLLTERVRKLVVQACRQARDAERAARKGVKPCSAWRRQRAIRLIPTRAF